MQKDILDQNPELPLRVYSVWFSMVPTDARSRWNWTGGVLTDSRVFHYWDEQKFLGRWLATVDPETSDNGIVWDAFYLYGPDAKWEDRPQPLLSSGATVRAEIDELKRAVVALPRR